VYFLASDPPTSDERERDRLSGEVYAYDENFKQRQLWKVAVASGAEQQITFDDLSVLSFRLSRDGAHITLQRAPSPRAADTYLSEVWTLDADGGTKRVVTHNSVEEIEPELSPDNSQILFLADANAKLEPYYSTNLFLMPAEGGSPRALLPDFPYAFDRATWAPDGRSILAVVNMGVHSELFRIGVPDGSVTQLTSGRHAIPPWPAPAWQIEPRAGQIVMLFDEPTRFGEIWMMPIAGGAPARVTGVFDALARFALPRQEKYEWKGADRAPLEGVLMYPPDYQPGRRYPLVVQLHGGPMESDKFGAGSGLLLNYFPVLTARGYLVLRPNYRGSSGYGNAFYRDVVGHYFANMHRDVLAAVDALVAEGLADPDRLVAMGWSAGGHLTNKLITVTDRFRAASVGAGAADFISLYGQTDERRTRTLWFGGTPWQKEAPIDRYWQQSPVRDAASVKTPTLFFVGENDARVPMPQSVEMYRALKSNGVATHLYVGPREPHQWQGLRHQIRKANLELEWFEKYARGRSYTAETPPVPDRN
jgi:dipeptidyl aminopeptidase/acylaminoacyl peptidase